MKICNKTEIKKLKLIFELWAMSYKLPGKDQGGRMYACTHSTIKDGVSHICICQNNIICTAMFDCVCKIADVLYL